MEFMDLTPQQENHITSADTPISDVGEYHDVELNNFMNRPIRIATITMAYGTAVNGVFNPWSLFFNDTRVKNRLAYYNLLKCNLCLKFVVNGNAFQYGQYLFDYLPVRTFTLEGALLQDNMSFTDTTSVIYPNAQTHRKYIKVRPLDSQGACMDLPFFWPNNWLSVPREEWSGLGEIRYRAMNPVLHANNSTATDPPIITVFAWATDVKISVPTGAPPATLAPQAGEETVGKISGPISALSKFAGSMASVPIIGPYARATQMVGSGLGAMARLFGYSRPPIETPTVSMKPDYTGNIAATDRPEYINKLTVDSSQEVTVDPSVSGINFGDELLISKIAQRETYVTQFTWDYSQAADTGLFHIRVSPLLHALLPSFPTTRAVYPTAIEYASLPFQYWRGSMKFRFEVVCSRFHKGRLRVMFDPTVIPTVTNFNQNYQHILDLDASTDLTVEVNWTQPTKAQDVGAISLSTVKYGSTFVAPSATEDNGGLYLYVLNTLSVPNQGLTAANSLIYINVYVTAGDDFELCVPYENNLSALSVTQPFFSSAGEEFVPSAGEEGPMMDMFVIGEKAVTRSQDLDIWGEKYVSFRTLIKRYVDYLSFTFQPTTVNRIYNYFVLNRHMPVFAGNNVNGINSIANLIGSPGPFPGNNYKLNLLSYLLSAYSGCRGSFRYKYLFQPTLLTNDAGAMGILTRYPNTRSVAPASSDIGASPGANDLWQSAFRKNTSAWHGAQLVNLKQQPLLEIEDPYYEKYKFFNPKMLTNNDVTIYDGHVINIVTVNGALNAGIVCQSYVATGEDFNLLYYTGPPLLWTSAYYI